MRARLLQVLVTVLGITSAQVAPAADESRLAVKVMVINMFSLEAAPWLKALAPTRAIAVTGLSSDYPEVHCTPDAVCQMTTGMGHANAAASTMALLLSAQFDLRQTYFIIAGIAGIDPMRGTIGSATWARYAIDSGIAHEIDARDMPRGWSDGYFGVLTDGPNQKPRFDYRTEVFRLNEALLQQAVRLSRNASLEDSPDVQAYRRHYPSAPANAAPGVVLCDTETGDTWWSGDHLSEHARTWARLLTDGAGTYCTTQEEDNATLEALTRGQQAGLVDIQRVAILRTASDFDRPYPGQSALETLQAQRELQGAIRVSTDNLVVAGKPLVGAIVAHWDQWRGGVPSK